MALKLLQFDSCPFCRRVRDVIDELGIEVEIVHIDPWDRSAVVEVSGQSGVPVLVDESSDLVMPESADIIAYLREHYG